MRRLVAAEFLKLRTTRTSWILTAAALGLIAVFQLLNFALKEIRPGTTWPARSSSPASS